MINANMNVNRLENYNLSAIPATEQEFDQNKARLAGMSSAELMSLGMSLITTDMIEEILSSAQELAGQGFSDVSAIAAKLTMVKVSFCLVDLLNIYHLDTSCLNNTVLHH